MLLPNANAAQVSEQKIVDYLFSFAHPDGASQARFFVSLGFRPEDWQLLAEAFRQLATDQVVTKSIQSVHGTKDIIEGSIASPSGRSAQVRTIWITDEGQDAPRLVTAYPCQ